MRARKPRTSSRTSASWRSPDRQESADRTTPFRFYDNRQKYLAFVTTCDEKAVIARRAAAEFARTRPQPPAIRFFDAGMGDGTVLARLMSSAHRSFPTVPQMVVAKEISLEDVRLGLEKMAERFHEHPTTVLVMTNLSYQEAPYLTLLQGRAPTSLNWQTVALEGSSSNEYLEQIDGLGHVLADGWRTEQNHKTGNPMVVRPSVLVIYRKDYEFQLDSVIPRKDLVARDYDFVLASQPWQARLSADFKARRVLAPLVRSLKPGGRLLAIQSYGHDPGVEIVRELWPGEDPFRVGRRELLAALALELGNEARQFDLKVPSDSESLFQFHMHTLPSEIGDRVGTSTLLAAWNAVIYVNQIEDERLASVLASRKYLEVTRRTLHRYGRLWFNDESFVVKRIEALHSAEN